MTKLINIGLALICIVACISMMMFNSTTLVTQYTFKPVNRFEKIHLSIKSMDPTNHIDLLADKATENNKQWNLETSSVLIHQKTPWTVEAPHAILNLAKNTLKLKGGVQAKQWQTQCNRVVVIDDLEVDFQKKIAQTSNQVHLVQGSSTILGEGLQIFFQKDTVVLDKIKQSLVDLTRPCSTNQGNI